MLAADLIIGSPPEGAAQGELIIPFSITATVDSARIITLTVLLENAPALLERIEKGHVLASVGLTIGG